MAAEAAETTIPVKKVEEEEQVVVPETNKENTTPVVEAKVAPTVIVDPSMQKTYGLVVKQVEHYYSGRG